MTEARRSLPEKLELPKECLDRPVPVINGTLPRRITKIAFRSRRPPSGRRRPHIDTAGGSGKPKTRAGRCTAENDSRVPVPL